MTTKNYWFGTQPTNCDICNNRITTVFVDGKTIHGPWAVMCPSCHDKLGCGLGVGKGQKYESQSKGEWLKMEG